MREVEGRDILTRCSEAHSKRWIFSLAAVLVLVCLNTLFFVSFYLLAISHIIDSYHCISFRL